MNGTLFVLKTQRIGAPPAPFVPVASVFLLEKNITLDVGDFDQLIEMINPPNASNKNVIWVSSDENVADVDQNGIVTALAPGVAVITVLTEDGNFSDTCTVNVNATEPPTQPPAKPVISILTQPAASTNVTQGNISGSLSLAASVTESASLSYQWYSNAAASNSGGSPIGGATGASMTIPTGLSAGTHHYYCVVSASGGAAPVASNAAAVNVAAPPPPTPVISILTQPAASTNVTQGNISGSLSLAASVTESASLAYQWYSNAAAANSGGSPIGGATGASMTIPTGLSAGTHHYYCVVSASGGAAPVDSNAATVNVAAPPPSFKMQYYDEEVPAWFDAPESGVDTSTIDLLLRIVAENGQTINSVFWSEADNRGYFEDADAVETLFRMYDNGCEITAVVNGSFNITRVFGFAMR